MVYTGTLSKVLLPALRLGYMVAPPGLQPAISGAKWLTDRHVALLYQAVLALFIDEGYFERHLRRMRKVYERRRAALLESFGDLFGDRARITGTESGMHVLVHLQDVRDADTFIRQAGERGVGIYSARPYHTLSRHAARLPDGLFERQRGRHPRGHPAPRDHRRVEPRNSGRGYRRAPPCEATAQLVPPWRHP